MRLCLHDEFQPGLSSTQVEIQPGTQINAIARLHDNPGLEAGLRVEKS